MGVVKLLLVSLVIGSLTAGGFWCFLNSGPKHMPDIPDVWFGHGSRTKEDETITKFTINVSQEVLTDLKRRLDNTKFAEPLEDVEGFQNGFNPKQLQQVVKYWSTKYDWRKTEKELNKYQHYKTQIEGLSVHFVRIPPTSKAPNAVIIPLMIVHGWPGSFYEFYKLVPELQKLAQGSNIAFDIILPSIPGYGFSEAPHKQGFHVAQAARIFNKLMTRLGFKQYYLQGGDWGSGVVHSMSLMYPDRVLGVHLNMPFTRTPLNVLRMIVGAWAPSLIYTPQETEVFYPFSQKIFKELLFEAGYFLIQATKPDTVGAALTDSPAGLAAYILEKFSTATEWSNRQKKDGGLTDKFTMDELLTDVMIYWVTGSITSSQRLYKENMLNREMFTALSGAPVTVPTGVVIFPNEIPLNQAPKSFCEDRYNLVTYTKMPRGGHFAAMEQPALLAEDIVKFITAVRNLPKTK